MAYVTLYNKAGEQKTVHAVDVAAILPYGEWSQQPPDGGPVEPVSEPLAAYSLHDRGGGWYDVVNAAGEAQNPGALHREDAEALLQQLEAQHDTA